MSKASEWATAISTAKEQAREVERQRPAPFCLHMNASARVDVSVDDDGSPRWVCESARNGYKPEVDRLRAFAHWILDTFGEKDEP